MASLLHLNLENNAVKDLKPLTNDEGFKNLIVPKYIKKKNYYLFN